LKKPVEPLIMSHKNFSQEEESKTVFSKQEDKSSLILPQVNSEPAVTSQEEEEHESESGSESESEEEVEDPMKKKLNR
jgi:hypothetical protein